MSRYDVGSACSIAYAENSSISCGGPAVCASSAAATIAIVTYSYYACAQCNHANINIL